MIDDAYLALIHSDRVSARTRSLLLARAAPDGPEYRPVSVAPERMPALRAVLDRVLPQPPGGAIDLGARVDAGLALGDGWRHAHMPPDADAYDAALRTLDAAAQARHGAAFAALGGAEQDALLHQADAGELDVAGAKLDARQMRTWFEELRADAAKAFVAHPATLARMGYGGIACGGDAPRKQGFARVGIGEREAWEPVAHADLPA